MIRWQDDDDGAMSDMDRFVKLAPKSFGAYFFRGVMACVISHDDDRALADLNRAVSLEPGFAFSYALRSFIYARRLQLVPALSDFVLSIRRVGLLEFKFYCGAEEIDGEPDRFQFGLMWFYDKGDQDAGRRGNNASTVDTECAKLAMNSLFVSAFAPAR